MNQSTKIMFLIGFIFNVIEITALMVLFIACCMFVGMSDEIYVNLTVDWFNTPEEFTTFLTTGAVSCSFGVVISAAVLVCAVLAYKAQDKQPASKIWPIVMIVLGALNNILYLVAGVLSLIENQQLECQCASQKAATANNAPVKNEALVAPVAIAAPAAKPAAKPAVTKKAPAKKPAAKKEAKVVAKAPAKKTEAKPAAKKAPAKKPAAKAPIKKTVTKKPAAKPAAKKPAVTKKAPAKKPAAKPAAKKTAAKPAVKKAPAKKPAAKKIVKR